MPYDALRKASTYKYAEFSTEFPAILEGLPCPFLQVDLLKAPPFRQYVLKLLYHFTADDRCKNLMT